MTMHDAKAQAADAFAAFTGVPLPENPAQALRSIRRQAKEEIELLIAFLDSTENDPDFEEADPPEDDAPREDVGDNEPSLGAPGTFTVPDQTFWAQGSSDDREDESELLEENGDGEPTLGATAALNQETAWRANPAAWGACDEEEPSLGWTGHGRGHPESARLTRGYDHDLEQNIGADDRELDHAERSGIGDYDGMVEQGVSAGWGEYAE
jgi:hypothetical protein